MWRKIVSRGKYWMARRSTYSIFTRECRSSEQWSQLAFVRWMCWMNAASVCVCVCVWSFVNYLSNDGMSINCHTIVQYTGLIYSLEAINANTPDCRFHSNSNICKCSNQFKSRQDKNNTHRNYWHISNYKILNGFCGWPQFRVILLHNPLITYNISCSHCLSTKNGDFIDTQLICLCCTFIDATTTIIMIMMMPLWFWISILHLHLQTEPSFLPYSNFNLMDLDTGITSSHCYYSRLIWVIEFVRYVPSSAIVFACTSYVDRESERNSCSLAVEKLETRLFRRNMNRMV